MTERPERAGGARRSDRPAAGPPRETAPAGGEDRPVRDAAGVETSEGELAEWDPMPDELDDGVEPVPAGEDPMEGPAPSG